MLVLPVPVRLAKTPDPKLYESPEETLLANLLHSGNAIVILVSVLPPTLISGKVFGARVLYAFVFAPCEIDTLFAGAI
jgi:hypothetical protein